MAPYILGKRGLIHIIDIKETLKGLLRAKKFVTKVVNGGKDVLFVGTKRQAREIVRMQAARCEMPYVCERWLGGTLTNFRTIRSRLARLEELEALDASGAMGGYSKKMESSLKRERRKIQRNLEGIRNMTKVPGALILVDVRREHIAVKEAKKLGIPTLCLLDTDGDPDVIDLPIPGNDDAMRSIEVVLSQLADAVMEGKAGRDKEEPPQEDEKRPARRRSARAMATAPTDAAPTDAAEAPADVAVADQNPDAGAPEADAAPVTPEPAPSAETAEADPAEPAQSEGETEPQTP